MRLSGGEVVAEADGAAEASWRAMLVVKRRTTCSEVRMSIKVIYKAIV